MNKSGNVSIGLLQFLHCLFFLFFLVPIVIPRLICLSSIGLRVPGRSTLHLIHPRTDGRNAGGAGKEEGSQGGG